MKTQPTLVDPSVISRVALQLFQEAYQGPADSKGTWFVDNEPDCGILGTLRNVSAGEASSPILPGRRVTVASHVAHLRFALSLANRAARGEDAFAGADWAGSWGRTAVTDEEWSELVSSLTAEVEELRLRLAEGLPWHDEETLAETLAQIAHGAWHLGAIRQALGKVVLPGE